MAGTSCFHSAAFKVISLGCLGVAIMIAIALSLAYTLGANPPKSTVKYSSIYDPAMKVVADTKPCSDDALGACGTVLTYGTPNSSAEVTVSSAGADASGAQVRLCFGKAYTVDRPWRSANDVIGKDKQCAKVACQIDSLDGGEGKCTYNVGDTTGTAVYYFRALAVDSSGKFIAASQDAEDGYFQVNSYQGRTQSIIVGVAVMSVVAWTILIGGLVWEKVKKV